MQTFYWEPPQPGYIQQ